MRKEPEISFELWNQAKKFWKMRNGKLIVRIWNRDVYNHLYIKVVIVKIVRIYWELLNHTKISCEIVKWHYLSPPLEVIINIIGYIYTPFYLPLGRYRNGLVRPTVRHNLFAPFPSSTFSRNFQGILVLSNGSSGHKAHGHVTMVTKVKY